MTTNTQCQPNTLEPVYSDFEPSYIESVLNENKQLKELNEKLYKRTLNQKRKLLRLKKKLYGGNSESVETPIDSQWEDVTDVLAELSKKNK
jgi:hypothetical protein